MGLSLVTAVAVIGVSIFMAIELFSGSLLPAVSDFNDSYHDIKDRLVEKVQTDINVTGVVATFSYGGSWWDGSWMYQKNITLDHNMVVGDLTNFPVLIDITDSDLAARAQSDGDDIAFVNADHSVQFNHEIESYTSATGHLIAWVNVTSVTSGSDTELHMYYGNPGCGSQENIAGTWDSDYLMVQHLNESSGDLLDSTNNNNDLKVNGATYDSGTKIDGGYDFDGDTDYLESSAQVMTDNTVTYGGWVKLDTRPGAGLYTVPMQQADAGDGGYEIYNDRAGGPGASTYNFWTWDGANAAGPFVATEGIWYHVMAVHDGSDMYLYVNGTSIDSAGSAANPAAERFIVGGGKQQDDYWIDGQVDEVRISDIVRTGNWLDTSYQNQNNPSGFASFDDEEERNLNITITNMGSTNPELNDLSVLINGTSYAFVSSGSFLYPQNEAYLTVSLPQSGTQKVGVITHNGIADYYTYTP